MNEKYPEFDEKDPKTAERLAILDKINAQTTDKCNSWADLYQGLKDQAFKYLENPSKENADFTITLMLSFVLALEDLPEEGEAKTISRKVNEILVMHPERTGVALYFGAEAEQVRASHEREVADILPMLQCVASMLAGGAVEVITDDTTGPVPPTRTLH